MKAYDQLGVFWLAGHGDDQLSGRLQFDPTAGGIKLSLVGKFDNSPDENHGEPTLRVMGWIGTSPVTLAKCFLLGTHHRAPGVIESRYHANQMFVGYHFDHDELEFRAATATFSDLDSWVGRSGITEDSREAEAGRIYSMSFTPITGDSHEFARGRIALGFCWEGNGDPIHGVEFRQWPIVKIDYGTPQAFQTIQEDVSRVQSLLTLCVDAPTMLDDLVLTRPDIKVKMLSGKEGPYDQPIEFVAPPLRYVEPKDRKHRHWFEMLLSYDELGGVAAVAQWLDASEGFQAALDSFMSIKRRDQMFGENRFLNVTYAAEAFHRVTQGGTQMDEELYARLAACYMENTPADQQQWLKGKLQHGNTPTLRKRLLELAKRSGPATQSLIGKKDHWAYTVAQLRDELTHLGGNARSSAGSDLLYLTESVFAVVRICMLLEAGVSAETLAKKANSPAMTWYKSRLQDSIKRVRAEFLNR